MIDTKYKYEVVFFVDNFKNYDYFATLKEAMDFAKTVDAIKIMKGRKIVKDFKNGESR